MILKVPSNPNHLVVLLHDCLNSQVFLETLNLLFKLFGTETLILPCFGQCLPQQQL